MDANLHRLHRALVNAIRQKRGSSFDTPVTVAEIYQQLLPYRAARDAVGFQMNADYEYALLRLLAGEGHLARLEPSEAREALRAEIESPNPNVSLFRDFAACDVWISANTDSDIDVDLEEARMARNGKRFVPELVTDDDFEIEAVLDDPAPPVAKRSPAAGAAGQQCTFCGGTLPNQRLINFCPHCGNDLTHRPCATCGETMDPQWRFCISCGASATTFDTEAN